MVLLELSSTSHTSMSATCLVVHKKYGWWNPKSHGLRNLRPTFQLHVANSDCEDSKAKDLSAIGLSLRVSIIALVLQVWGCLCAGIVHRYFHVLLSINTFCSRNVQRWGSRTAARGLWHTAGLNVHQTPFCFVLPLLLFIYSQSLISRSCRFLLMSLGVVKVMTGNTWRHLWYWRTKCIQIFLEL